jgi:leucyl aminopeptidase
MPYPALSVTESDLRTSGADAALLVVPPPGDPFYENESWSTLGAVLGRTGFSGSVGSYLRVDVPEVFDGPLAVVGSGSDADAAALRTAAGAGIRQLTGFTTVAVAAPAAPGAASALLEGAGLGGYRFEGYKSNSPARRASSVVVHDVGGTDEDVAAAEVTAGAVALVKDLTSIPAEWLGPDDLAQRAAAEVAGLPVEVTILDERAMAEQGFGGILGVGQGSDRPPRFVRLDYRPAGASRHVAVVGKGITFDTGGLSLKPPASMVGMKDDMCGAAVALAVVRAAAQLELPVGVSAYLCIADNMPSGRAIRPGDVLRMLDGTTVEVLNTDAEGRLVLADGLVAASRDRPDLIVDVATLTGAIITALGTRLTGVMGDDDAAGAYLAAAERAAEPSWRLPLPDHMEDELDSPIADLVNAKIGDPAGGSLFAGLFLRRFVGRVSDAEDAARIPWVHLDIAGSAWHKGSPYGFTDKGATGAGVRALIELLRGQA